MVNTLGKIVGSLVSIFNFAFELEWRSIKNRNLFAQ
jgi:hypothetical protein